jgi:signal transduction histidine kinase
MDLLPIVREVVLLVQSDILARHVSIELDVSLPIPHVHGDPTLVRQALLNIVLDALEAASSSAGPHRPISLAIRQVADAVEVAVTHVGLRTESAAIDDWGLALARSVVVAHHGTITLEGDADAGVRLVTRWPMTPHGTVHEEHHAE